MKNSSSKSGYASIGGLVTKSISVSTASWCSLFQHISARDDNWFLLFVFPYPLSFPFEILFLFSFCGSPVGIISKSVMGLAILEKSPR